jgi:luciferase-like monooxygenase
MNLAEKGRYAPPPRLPVHARAVSQALAKWPGVHARTHWLLGDETEVDGADFYVGERELGHIHLQGEAHIAVPAPVRKALVESGLAAPFQWSPGFVVCQIATAAEVPRAKALFQLAYDGLQGVSSEQLVARCASLARARAAVTAPRAT